MDRFDSTAIFSIFKNEDGENLLPFDEMAALLDLGELPDLSDNPPLISNVPIATAAEPAGPIKQEALPTVSGIGDSEHTRAQGWGSNHSSDDGGDGDSGGSDMDGQPQHDNDAPSPSPFGGSPSPAPSNRTGSRGKATSGVKKRRQRNADQMESNRVAQQKYRQRKKKEQSALQQAVDMLTAQVTALKAVEVRASELESSNAALRASLSQQGASLGLLQQHSAAQTAELEATRAALVSSQAQVAAQGRAIVDQQAKLRLQEQVIASLKDRLKERIDEALQHVVPGTVCEKMVAAVKATLYGAKDVSGLQETLAQLPEQLVTELCKNIFHVCKETWPELRLRCSQQVGEACMAGRA
ncbi:hypothetical protein Agub_g8851 [Astrephomene gubernaculifera]|uniref:BZIP domain-containing protein n=1 Tax=Astrephomene gubernaculifera TaxID=47775 RepID=A0AAD3DSC2_9CHLO|nr:hypothetical protein Agub_g8851 [Astrephomene gubernaculifera]